MNNILSQEISDNTIGIEVPSLAGQLSNLFVDFNNIIKNKVKKYSTYKLYDGQYFDLIYINETSSYDEILCDIEDWWPKLKLGGMLSGSSFGNEFVRSVLLKFFDESEIETYADNSWKLIKNRQLLYKKIDLKNVTLLTVDCVDANRSAEALEISKFYCDFGAVKLLTSLETDYEHAIKIHPINSLEEYSEFLVKELPDYVDTDFVLIQQWDGFVLNNKYWLDEFLEYDYIGAPWAVHDMMVGNGGFSLRSKRMIHAIKKHLGGMTDFEIPEDVMFCKEFRRIFELDGIKFAPKELAMKFSYETAYQVNDREQIETFGHHCFRVSNPVMFGWTRPPIDYPKYLVCDDFKIQKYIDIWNNARELNVQQKFWEFINYYKKLEKKENKKNVLEIGSAGHGMTYTHYQCCDYVCSIDSSSDENQNKIKTKYPNFDKFVIDSHSQEAIDLIRSLNKKFDVIFIDGDHSLNGVRADYDNYKEFLTEDGWIVFHDILNSDWHRSLNCFVAFLWWELCAMEQYDFEEIFSTVSISRFSSPLERQLDNPYIWGGIGILKNKKESNNV